MPDSFDAFAAFDPFDGPDAGDPEPPAEQAVPDKPPAADPTETARVATRRWSAARRSPVVPERAATKPAVAEEAAPTTPPDCTPPDTVRAPDSGLGTIRAIALPELRAAVARLRGHRHDAEVVNELDEEAEPRLALRFRPDAGPLGFAMAGVASDARFELRLAGPKDTDPDGGIQVFAGYMPAGGEKATLVPLGRTPVHALTSAWVAQRIVEFVARTLEA